MEKIINRIFAGRVVSHVHIQSSSPTIPQTSSSNSNSNSNSAPPSALAAQIVQSIGTANPAHGTMPVQTQVDPLNDPPTPTLQTSTAPSASRDAGPQGNSQSVSSSHPHQQQPQQTPFQLPSSSSPTSATPTNQSLTASRRPPSMSAPSSSAVTTVSLPHPVDPSSTFIGSAATVYLQMLTESAQARW